MKPLTPLCLVAATLWAGCSTAFAQAALPADAATTATSQAATSAATPAATQAATTPPDASASTQAPTEIELNPVQVSNARGALALPWKTALKGIAAYDKHHAALAPRAPLRVEVVPIKNGATLEGETTVRFIDDAQSLELPRYGATYGLPQLTAPAGADAELRANRSATAARFRPHVQTPGLPPQTLRLGDLRLNCEVLWAVSADDTPWYVRAGIATVGGLCHSSLLRIVFLLPERMASATLRDGERELALAPSTGGYGLSAPLHDTSWSHEARITWVAAPADATPANPAPAGAAPGPAATPKP